MITFPRILSLVTAAAALTVAGAVLAPSAALADPIVPIPIYLATSRLHIAVDQAHVTPGTAVNVKFSVTDTSGNPIAGALTLTETSADGSVKVTLLNAANSMNYSVTNSFTSPPVLTAPGDYSFTARWTPPTGVIGATNENTAGVQVRALGATGALSVGKSVAGSTTPVTMAVKVPSAAYTTAGTVHVQLDATSDAALCSTGPGQTSCTAQLPGTLAVGAHTATVTWVGVNYNAVTQMVNFTTLPAPKVAPKPAPKPASGSSTAAATTPTSPAVSPSPSTGPTVAPQPANIVPTPNADPQLDPTPVASSSPLPLALILVGIVILALLIAGAIILITVARNRRVHA